MAKRNLTPIKDLYTNRQQQAPVAFMAGGFGSRGTAMLRAALSEKQRCLESNINFNNHGNTNHAVVGANNAGGGCISPIRTPIKERARIIEEHRRTKLQQLNSPNANEDLSVIEEQQSFNDSRRKRSPKNKVLFSKPVVTKEYEYEQTILLDANDHNHRNGSCSAQKPSDSDDCDKLTLASRKLQSRRSKSSQARTADTRQARGGGGALSLLQQNNLTTIHDNGDEHNDDDDDELYTMAPSSFQEVVETPRNSKKRPREDDSNNEATDGNSKVTSSAELHLNHYDDGGLFHSPKIAKIAPYYDDELDSSSKPAHQADVKSATHDGSTNATFQPQLSSRQSKSVQQRLCYPISKNYSLLASITQRTEHTNANNNENANCEALNVTLKSLNTYNNNINSATDNMLDRELIQDATTTATATAIANDWNEESMSSQQTYFNWISNGLNFLSNKMNKLIF